MIRIKHLLVIAIALSLFMADSYSDSWPMWGGNAQHTFASDNELPNKMALSWTLDLEKPDPAWPENKKKLQFDVAPSPVIADGTVFTPSTTTDSITAIDLETGNIKWIYYCNGPVRFAPAALTGRIYFGSDDGFLYCLEAKTGKLVWKFQGGPNKRMLLGNDRLISMWAIRGAPVISDGKIYFSAGIWPFMGVFIYALDAETGKVIWSNSSTGSMYINQQHSSPAFAGVSPQGYMTIAGDKLLVPGGRTVPMALNLKDGSFLYFNLADRMFGKDAGGYDIKASKDYFFNKNAMFYQENGIGIKAQGAGVVGENDFFYAKDGKLYGADQILKTKKSKDRKGKEVKTTEPDVIWEHKPKEPIERIMLKAGNSLICLGEESEVFSIDTKTKKSSWSIKLPEDPVEFAQADGRLILTGASGAVYCLGNTEAGPRKTLRPALREYGKIVSHVVSEALSMAVRTENAYALLLQPDSTDEIDVLLRESKLLLIIIEDDLNTVQQLRKKYYHSKDNARVHIVQGSSSDIILPPYFADVIIAGKRFAKAHQATDPKMILNTIRPYGGLANFPSACEAWIKKGLTENEIVLNKKDQIIVKRPNALKGAANWTHQSADSENSLFSKDKLAKAPLGLLWFGGPSNDKILPRHGHGPSPQVFDGRLFIEGLNIIRAIDIYTGRLLWEKEIKDIGKYYDNTGHHPGANEIGSNYACAKDAVYVLTPSFCLKLNPTTGAEENRFTLPNNAKWGYMIVKDDYLITAGSPLFIEPSKNKKKRSKEPPRKTTIDDIEEIDTHADYSSASKMLYALNRHTGSILWEREAAYSFRHNSVIASSDKVFCIDAFSPDKKDFLKRRGVELNDESTLYALDIKTGKVIWGNTKNVFGTWLSHSAEYNLLFQGGSSSRDRASDEVGKGMAVLKSSTGDLVWRNDAEYSGPCILQHHHIITQGQGKKYNLLTGKQIMIPHLLTGKPTSWNFSRNYGCNTAIASENLIAFRSAAAGYYNLANDSGTGNFGGFKSGCTSNLIPGGGLLNAPDYTRTCVCSYQNQVSLALVHMPEVETWTFIYYQESVKEIKKMGVNFGAPGDRMSENGVLWLEWPINGSPSPKVHISSTPETVKSTVQHTSLIKGSSPLKWVASSSIIGAKEVEILVGTKGTYTVRLVFPKVKESTVFDIAINGENKLSGFSPSKAIDPVIIQTYKGVKVDQNFVLTLTPKTGETVISGLELVME